jgi:hypothetical protein
MRVQRFCEYTAGISGFKHIRSKSLLDRLLGPDAWYVAKFYDPKTTLCMTYWRWGNSLSAIEYMNSVRIEYQGEMVYQAEVSRYKASSHRDVTYVRDEAWQEAMGVVMERYARG